MRPQRKYVYAAVTCVLTSLLVATQAPAPAAARLAAAFPGTNGRIVFSSAGDLFTMSPTGTGRSQLTDTVTENETDPSWSADGSRIVYQSLGETGPDIFTIRSDGTATTRLTASDGRNQDPAWSPDGTRIVFASDRERTPGLSQIWMMDADGTNEELLFALPANSYASAPTWSPDGSRIAYLSNGAEAGLTGIHTAAADGSDITRLTESPDGTGPPDWSPDGTLIAFDETSDGGNTDIYVMARDGTGRQQLTTDDAAEYAAAWSPDGRSLAYTRTEPCDDCTGVTEVWTMDAGGADQQRITTDDAVADQDPSWQPEPRAASILLTPASAAPEVGDEHQVIATALDAEDRPLEGIDLHLRITGQHTQSATRNTGEDGEVGYTWEGSSVGTDTVVVCDDADSSGTCEPAETSATATALWSPRTPVDRPRLAFTDDADALYTMTVTRAEIAGVDRYTSPLRPASYATSLTAFEAGPTHEGEAGGVPTARPVFVSTRDDPRGEVYRAPFDPATPPERITCDPGTETHPVASVNGLVAYASDADGDWDIYVSIPPPDPGPGRVAPFGRAPLPAGGPLLRATACDATSTTVNVTDEPDGEPTYDDLWPTWTYGGGADGTALDGLAFSRAATGELPDLFTVTGTGPAFGAPVQLTSTPAVAETQPAAMTLRVDLGLPCDPDIFLCPPTYVARVWIAHTTSSLRSSGTVAFLSPEDPDEVVRPTPSRFQASEPVWDSIYNPSHLAVTTIEEDPYGGIAIAEVAEPTEVGGVEPSNPVVSGLAAVRGRYSGLGESHPFWVEAFDDDAPATLVFTGRADDETAGTSRQLHADISDVLAVDGSQRRTIRRKRDLEAGEVVFRYDEAGPAYSPDGDQVVWSEDVDDGVGGVQSRVLMLATDDGDAPQRLLPATSREPYDVDLDPVWSPDASRIAFVRMRRGDESAPGPAEVWVYDLAADSVTRMPGAAVEGDGADLSPSWAPDSRHLVIARSQGGGGDPLDAARRWSQFSSTGSPRLVILDVTAPAAAAVELDYCRDGCDVRGRSPSWSPDGTRIAYEYDAQIEVFDLPAPCCAGPVMAVGVPVAVTGFTRPDQPTASRATIAQAQDPAWSPDGREIAFAGQPVGMPDKRGIWGIAPDGTGLRSITDEPGPETEPAWQGQRDTDLAVSVSVAPSPVLTGSPTVATFTVRNNGPFQADGVSLTTGFAPDAQRQALPGQPAGCRANGSGCEFAALVAGATRTYRVRLRHPEPLLGVATGTVTADRPPDPDLTNNAASALYRVQATDLKVRIKLDEPIGYVGGLRTAVVTVRNIGSAPLVGVDLAVVLPVEVDAFTPPVIALQPPPAPACLVDELVCLLGTLAPGEKRRYRMGLEMLVAPADELAVTLFADVSTSTPEVDLTNNTDEVDFEILQPEIRVLPSVAPAGRVVLAYAEKMPPGSQIELGWSIGITIHRGPFVVSDEGTVRLPLLVVRHDQLGVRVLTATSLTDLFTPVDGDLLVVPPTLGPPNFNGRS